MNSKELFDNYTIKARLYPALLVFMVPIIILSALAPELYGSLKGAIVVAFSYCGGTLLLANLGRDNGKKKELGLFTSWGGPPTHVKLLEILRRDSIGKLHQAFNRHLPSLQLAPGRASIQDQALDDCIVLLRSRTRDKKKYPLLFEENCNYGFRRNTWGLKVFGATFSVLALIGAAAALYYRYVTTAALPSLPELFALVFGFLMTLLWLFWFTPNWIKIAGDAYADRLLEACKDL